MYRQIGAVALLGATLVSACSKEAPKPDSTVAQAGAATAPTAGYDPATRVLTVLASDFTFTAPDSVPGGWTTFRLVNKGPNLHHIQLVRVDSGKTMADVQAAMSKPDAPPPKWLVEVGGPNAPDVNGESLLAMNLQPGLYVMVCFIPIPDNVPHVAKGMVKPITVTAPTAPGTAPAADVVLSLSDYAFTVKSGTLSAGKHTIQIVNDGPQVHEVQIFKLLPGKTMKDLGAWGAKFEGPAPVTGIGGVVGMVKGLDSFFTVDLTPGNYVMICFIPDAKDKKPHLEHGMVKEFTVQ